MDKKRLVDIFDEKISLDKEVHFYSTAYDINSYAQIFKNANTTRPIPNSLNVNEALLIMLQVVHSFKYSIDMYYDHIDESEPDERNKEIEDIINHRLSNVKKKPFELKPHHLITLLLEVLYEINGAHYRSRDPDYIWEEELDEILELPNWSYELDSSISQFLLLPLYYATHHHLGGQK
jgi:hypothetical protein